MSKNTADNKIHFKMNDEIIKKIEELFKDEEYMKYLLSLHSAEKMSEELKKKDIELKPKDIKEIGNLVKKKQNGELLDEELEKIAGGLDPFTVGLLAALGIGATGAGIVAIASSVDC